MFLALKNIVRHSTIYSVGTFLGSATGFFLLPIYTIYLAPADYGILEMLTVSINVLVILCLLGVPNGLDKSFLMDAATEKERKTAVTTAVAFVFMASSLILGVAVLFADELSSLLLGQSFFGLAFVIAMTTSFIRMNYAVPMRLMRAEMKSFRYATIELIGFAVTIVLNVYFVVDRQLGLWGILYGDLIGSMTVLLGIAFFLRRYLAFGFSATVLKQMLRFGAPLVPAMLAMWILRVSDRFFLQHFSSTAEVGLYSMAVRFAMILEMLVYVPFNNNWPAVFFRVANQKNAKTEFSSLFTYFFLMFCFFALAISIFSRPAILMMTTPAYYGAVQAVPLLILSSLFLGIYTNVTVGFSITGKTEYHALTVLLGAAINVALNFILIPQYGMLGAAAASVCAFGVKMLAGYLLAMRLYPIPYDFLRLIRIAAAFSLPFILHEVIIPASLPLEIIFDLGLLAGYLGLLIALGFFSPQERAWVREQVTRVRNGLMALRSVEYERSNA